MIGIGGGTITILILQFNVVREQFGQIFAVIVIVFMDIIQEEDQPVAEVHFACLLLNDQIAKCTADDQGATEGLVQ